MDQMLAVVTMLTITLWVYKVRKVEDKFMWAVVITALALWFSVIAALVCTLFKRKEVLCLILQIFLKQSCKVRKKTKSVNSNYQQNEGSL